MMPNIRRLVEVISKTAALPNPIVELGSYIVEGQEELANLRDLFPNRKYTGCDIRMGLGVDRIEDVENLTYPNESIGTILILETLEHVQNPDRAMEEIYRVLKKEGIVIISSLMNFHIHDYPKDYWRFTPEGFAYLMRRFPITIIGTEGKQADFPINIFGIGLKSRQKKIGQNIYRNLLSSLNYIRENTPKEQRILEALFLTKEAFKALFDLRYLKFELK